MSIKVEQTHNVCIPVGEYPAQITSIEETDGQYGPQLKFTFTISGGEYQSTTITGWASRTFSEKSKLYAWTKAAFGGVEIPPDYNFDSDAVLKRRVTLVIIKRASDDGAEFNKIDAVLPLKKPTPPRPAAQAPARAAKPAAPIAVEDDEPWADDENTSQ